MALSSKFFSFARLFLLCLLSVVLLVCSFPKIDYSPLMWIALVPWMFAIDGKRPRSVFGWSHLTGFLFFFGTLYWVMYVTWVGAVLLMLYLALFFGLFGLIYRYLSDQSLGFKILVLSSCWVALEFIRGHFLTGFGWAALCHSQYENLLLIQIADITGMYGISFLIVAVNVLSKENLAFVLGRSSETRKDLIKVNIVVLGILCAVYGYGLWRFTQAKTVESVRVAVVQGNIPQDEKWEVSNRSSTIEKYLRLSREALQGNPQLIIWPETAFPGLIEEMPGLMEQIREFVRVSKVPMLVGVVTEEMQQYYNSAVLISADGEMAERYDKLHLVPFGEFLPLRKQLPFLADFVPIDDFSSGREAKVFRLPADGKDILFSAVICFEDTLGYIVRRFAVRGAQFLVNMTNDAWFEDSKEPFMHLQSAVFHTIETRRSLVRAANTGVSCLIDPYGRVVKYLENEHGKKTYVSGAAVFNVAVNSTATFYTKSGDVFTYLCFLCILWAGYVRFARHRGSATKS